MTFRKSIIISLASHLVLFGGGLAFARFSGLLSWGHREPIMVTLVGDGGIASRTGEREKKQERVHLKTEQESNAHQPEMPSVKSTTIPDAADGRTAQTDDNDSGDGAGSEGEQAAGSSSASVSSEQWAVIVSSIERVKNYPRLARERGIQGVVRLRFLVRPQGGVERVEVIKSSGHEILDIASVRTVYRASPMPYVSGWVEVPISYVLK
jgi:protein TonB